MNRLIPLATACAVPAAFLALVAIPSSASGSGNVLRFVSTNPQNTDLDLGDPGLSPGDRQVFRNTAVRDGKQIGYEVGEAVIVEASDTGLTASVTSTLVLADGTVTLSAVFVEDFATGPTGLTGAVTGGTGRYRGARGEATGEVIPGTDDTRVTIRLR